MLELRGVTKAFPGVVANDGISLEIADGQVHAILGENGAGKSTLTKIIYGFHQPDSGSICFNGREVRFRSPADSRRMGIGMVFQDFSLIPSMSVLDNVALFMPDQPVLLRRAELRRRIVDLAERYGLRIDPGLTVAQLSMGERQKVELIKLLVAGADLLIFDEPTSVLAPQEVDNLFRIFEELTAQGHGVVFITHKVREAVAAAHVVTVLRRGKIAGSVSRPALDEPSLVSLMLGGVTPGPVPRNRTPPARGDAALEFEQVWSTDAAAGRGLRGADFRAYAGEILGVAGVAGNGQQELGETMLGLEPYRGRIRLFGEDIAGWSPADLRNAGVGYIPEDALGMALVPGMSVDENLVLGDPERSGPFWMDWDRIRTWLDQEKSGLPVPNTPGHARVEHLSGGNVQRVLLAREMGRSPTVLLACYPARGLDVATATLVRRLLLEQRDAGGTVVLVSEDLDELLNLSDRIVVLREGRTVGEFQPDDTSTQEIGLSMTTQ